MGRSDKEKTIELMKAVSEGRMPTDEETLILKDMMQAEIEAGGIKGKDHIRDYLKKPRKFKEQAGYYREALAGDYSHFEKLDDVLRTILASEELINVSMEIQSSCGKNADYQKLIDDKENNRLKEILDKYRMSPTFRLGISLGTRDNGNNKKLSDMCRAAESYMNCTIMEKTLEPLTAEKKDIAMRDKSVTNHEIDMVGEKQILTAKMLFMAQMANVDIIDKDKNGITIRDCTTSMSDLMAHGSRLCYIFPTDDKQREMFDAVLGENMGERAGVASRTAATHAVSRRKINGADFKEKKLSILNLPRVFSNQRGVDLPIGGFMEKGPGGKDIKADGTNGHLYIKAEEGDRSHYGALMIGLETDASGIKNQLGHKHSWMAKAAKQSSFLSDKKGLEGTKLGGRRVDLSHMDPGEFTSIMKEFETGYRKLQKEAANNAESYEKLKEINHILAGKTADVNTLADVAEKLGMDKEKSRSIIGGCRENKVSRYVEKPGFMTKVKAFFGLKSAKKHISEYRDYVNEYNEKSANQKREKALRDRIAADRKGVGKEDKNKANRELADLAGRISGDKRLHAKVEELLQQYSLISKMVSEKDCKCISKADAGIVMKAGMIKFVLSGNTERAEDILNLALSDGSGEKVLDFEQHPDYKACIRDDGNISSKLVNMVQESGFGMGMKDVYFAGTKKRESSVAKQEEKIIKQPSVSNESGAMHM